MQARLIAPRIHLRHRLQLGTIGYATRRDLPA